MYFWAFSQFLPLRPHLHHLMEYLSVLHADDWKLETRLLVLAGSMPWLANMDHHMGSSMDHQEDLCKDHQEDGQVVEVVLREDVACRDIFDH